MFSRISPPLLAFGGSLLVLTGLVSILYWSGERTRTTPTGTLVVYCAEAMRLPLEAIREQYESDFGQRVELRFDSSHAILAKLAITKQGDLFLPADDSYIQLAMDKELVNKGDVFNLARMHAVVIVRPGFPTPIKTWSDFLAPGNKLAIGNDATAIGKVLQEHLQVDGRWDDLVKHDPDCKVNVNEVLNSVRIGSMDAGIVWDVVAKPHSDITVVELPELASVQSRVQVAVTRFTAQRDRALHFIRYLRASDKGAPIFKRFGFADLDDPGPMDP
jgi:molybdate transport system substrate-binding protein